jgi:hypothetical protein
MRLFKCDICDHVVHFENDQCEHCHHRLGYIAPEFEMAALQPAAAGQWHAPARPGRSFRFCENAELQACNWVLPVSSPDRYCAACRHNRTVPNLAEADNMIAWRRMETAKHRLIYTLMRLAMPLPNRADDPQGGLVFDFLADPPAHRGPKVLTGHDSGLITLALTEANDAEREHRRTLMGEPYRTLLGHFRHEVGHFYWDHLIRDQGLLAECRAVFGNDEADYRTALQVHYRDGAPKGWQDAYVSSYATTHAWEDFAETWAHYLHIVDTLETASAFGIEVHPTIGGAPETKIGFDPYASGEFTPLIEAWLPLTTAMNSINRSMGLADLYPFVLSALVIEKLGFIHRLVHRRIMVDRQAA